MRSIRPLFHHAVHLTISNTARQLNKVLRSLFDRDK